MDLEIVRKIPKYIKNNDKRYIFDDTKILINMYLNPILKRLTIKTEIDFHYFNSYMNDVVYKNFNKPLSVYIVVTDFKYKDISKYEEMLFEAIRIQFPDIRKKKEKEMKVLKNQVENYKELFNMTPGKVKHILRGSKLENIFKEMDDGDDN